MDLGTNFQSFAFSSLSRVCMYHHPALDDATALWPLGTRPAHTCTHCSSIFDFRHSNLPFLPQRQFSCCFIVFILRVVVFVNPPTLSPRCRSSLFFVSRFLHSRFCVPSLRVDKTSLPCGYHAFRYNPLCGDPSVRLELGTSSSRRGNVPSKGYPSNQRCSRRQ